MTKNESITLRDIYDVVQRLEDKVDDRFNATEARINRLEEVASKGIVLGGIGMVLLSGIFSWVWEKLFK